MENKVLATIGDLEITQKDVEYMKKNMDPRLLSQFAGEEGEYYLLQELINQKLMAIDAKSSPLMEEESFKYEFESMKDNFIAQYMIKKLLDSVDVTEEEIKTFFDENEDSFGETQSVKASHILVGDLETAEKLYKEIQEGSDFGDVAKKHSTCPSSRNGGDLGFFGHGQMVKEFEEVAFKMAKDEVSQPVKTQFGYHIIKLTDIKTEPKQEFEEVKEDLRRTVVAKKQQDTYVQRINELREKYNIK